MNVAALKLMKALDVDYATAEALVSAGFATENQAKQASEKELTDIPGIGAATAKKIRGK